MKSKNFKLAKAISLGIASLLVCVAVAGCAPVDTNTQSSDSYTVCNDGEYYSETTYYYNEKEYENSVTELKQCNKKVRLRSAANAQSNEITEENGGEFYCAVTEAVWVEETAQEGVVADSRLLTKAEIDKCEAEYAIALQTYSAEESNLAEQNSPRSYEDSTSRYKLSITIVVNYYENTRRFDVDGLAMWESVWVWAWETETSAEEYHDDYMGITWGGGLLAETVSDMIGTYYDGGGNVSCGRTISNQTAGYVWAFHEKSGYCGKEMEIGWAAVKLIASGQTLGVKLTYVHTYGSIEGEVSLGAKIKTVVDKDGVKIEAELGPELTLSSKEKNWQIQVDRVICI